MLARWIWPGRESARFRKGTAKHCSVALETLGRREIEGDTANPGTAVPNGSSARNAGSAPEHREQEVLGDGWPFRVPERCVI